MSTKTVRKNPTDKLISRVEKEITDFIEGVLLLSAKVKTLNYNYFIGKLHSEVERIFFSSLDSLSELDTLKDKAKEMGYYDLLIIKCYNTTYESPADNLLLGRRVGILQKMKEEGKLSPEELYFYFGEKEECQ